MPVYTKLTSILITPPVYEDSRSWRHLLNTQNSNNLNTFNIEIVILPYILNINYQGSLPRRYYLTLVSKVCEAALQTDLTQSLVPNVAQANIKVLV